MGTSSGTEKPEHCRGCKGVVDLVRVYKRVRWGAAVRRGIGTGFASFATLMCGRCRRRKHGAWKYASAPTNPESKG